MQCGIALASPSYVVRARKYATDDESYIKRRGVDTERKYINLLGEIVSLNSCYEAFCEKWQSVRVHQSRLYCVFHYNSAALKHRIAS